MRQPRPVRSHAIDAGDGANGDNAFVGALIAHHTDRGHGKKHSQRLPDCAIQIGATQLFIENSISRAENPETLFRDIAEHAHGKSWPGKRMAVENFIWNAEF